MSSPFAGFNSVPSPQVIPIVPRQPSQIERMLPYILQSLELIQRRKMNQAENVVAGISPGTTYDALSPDQQKAVRRFYGRKEKDIPGTTVVKPFQNVQERVFSQIDQILPPGSPIRTLYDQAAARGQLSGAPQAPATIGAIETQVGTAEVEAGTQRQLAGLGQQQVAGAAGARTAIQAGAKPEELPAGQVMDFRQVFGFVPSEPMKAQMTNQLSMRVMTESLRVLSDPENSSLAGPLREMGITVADGVGSVALGVDQFVRDAANNRAAIWASLSRGEADITRTENDLAKSISEKSGGRIPIPTILGIWHGDQVTVTGPDGKKTQMPVSDTPLGQAAVQFMNAGFDAAMTGATFAGDPGVQNLELIRPLFSAFARDPRTLENVVNLYAASRARAMTTRELGAEPNVMDMDPATGERKADAWNRRYNQWLNIMRPVTREYRGISGLIGRVTGTNIGTGIGPGAGVEAPPPSAANRGMTDFTKALGQTYSDMLPTPPRGPQP